MKNILQHDNRLFVGYLPENTMTSARKNVESLEMSP